MNSLKRRVNRITRKLHGEPKTQTVILIHGSEEYWRHEAANNSQEPEAIRIATQLGKEKLSELKTEHRFIQAIIVADESTKQALENCLIAPIVEETEILCNDP